MSQQQLPLIYQHWDEQNSEPIETINRMLVSREVLFIRKLVDATVLRNKIWEHTSNETEGDYSCIYIKPFEIKETPTGEQIEQVVFARHDLAGRYEAEYWVVLENEYHLLTVATFEQTWHAAQVLLDHYLRIAEKHYEVNYAILDPNRKKILLFIQETSFRD
ncbi:hypothetical protein BEP19_05295 [Ammoniphilus oxalaticus]|uniref:Uncharacterized protein n=1 Tax=Ammoniphilus oxalaticus TaxID=66863 RepID=A0A419SIR3_9BACL|nr:hypothetical protein [Ammoniphilus oxalaticus]RKD23846.1 hypothetical protein BEP19_05295 [Ammoniphilus oxalaticus]